MSFRNPTHLFVFVFSFFAISCAPKDHSEAHANAQSTAQTKFTNASADSSGQIAAAFLPDSMSAQSLVKIFLTSICQRPSELSVSTSQESSYWGFQVFSYRGVRDFVLRAGLSPPEAIV